MDQGRRFFSSKRAASPHCFNSSRRAFRAVEIQIDRIWTRPVVTGSHEIVRAAIQDILIDVHFDFFALGTCIGTLERVVADPAFAQFKTDVNRLNDLWFKYNAKEREEFEHIDPRLPSEKHENRTEEVSEGGAAGKIQYGLSMRNGIFKHSNLSFDISRASFDLIKREIDALFVKIVGSCGQPGGGGGVRYNRSFDTDVLSAGIAGLLFAGHFQR